jgi:thimet oligopeptidase
MLKTSLYAALLAVLTTACMDQKKVTSTRTLTEIQNAGAKFKNVLTLPQFETTPDALKSTASQTIAEGNALLDAVGKLAPAQVNFDNTLGALDGLGHQVGRTMSRLYLIKETAVAEPMRDAATEAVKQLQDWAVGLDYREDVYRAVKAYADTKPALAGEDAKLLDETMRDYRRAGLALPKPERDEVEKLRKELVAVGTDFSTHIGETKKALKFTKAELEGVPESLLGAPGVKTGADEYTILVNVTWQYLAVVENAKREEVRKQLVTEQHKLAMAENTPLVEKILTLRHQIATKLGYQNWADYVIEVKMAKNGATALEFEQKLKTGLQPKVDAELEEFRKLKVRETGDANAKINLWDWRYYADQLKKEKYTVDAEQLRVYFPLQRCLDGMFTIYQRIFGLKFEQVAAPYKWVDDLQLWAVSDSQTGEPLGFFYLDMFPREGKFNHFAVFPIIDGKRLADGTYQRPVCSLVCNFPPPTPDKPSLLSHNDVETLFHEFGHAMHGILTRARFSRFAGSSVPGDFVEAPSQMLEAWIWDKKVLDSFAADYRDPSKKIPPAILDRLKESKYAIYGSHYRRQLSFGITDLVLHTQITDSNVKDCEALANKTLTETFLPVPENSFMIAYLGHFVGYDAGYYGYAWADAIAADMATVFENAPDGYFDVNAGRRLRDEIYAVGNSRDVSESIQKFLGRDRSIEPFLKKIGAK